MNIKNEIHALLLKNRPNLKTNSWKTYLSCLYTLYRNMEGKSIDFFTDDKNKIIDFIKDFHANKRKTYLSALYIITGIQDYKHNMLQNCKFINDNYKLQKLNEKQLHNWITFDDVLNKFNEYKEKVLPMFNNKAILKLIDVIKFFILGFNCLIPPRRSLDYCLLKIKNFDVNKHNYYSKSILTINVYKTFKVHGKIQMNLKELSPELDSYIKKWIKINQNDYLLFSSVNKNLSPTRYCQISNSIWNKRVSTDLYRSTYITIF